MSGNITANPNDLAAPYAASRQRGGEDAALDFLGALAVPEVEVRPGGYVEPPIEGSGGNGTDRSTILGDVVDAAGRVARNVGDATMQTLVSAPLGALREMFRAADDIGNFVTGAEAVPDEEATLAANPGRAIASVIPQGPDPSTPAGTVARDVAQFLAGFVGGGRVVRGVAGGAARTGVGRAGQAMAAGAISDFFASDPNRARLSELWNEAGLPANALTDYLRDRGPGSAAEQRLRATIEGTATGVAVEGLVAAAKGFRSALRARTGNPGALAAARSTAEAERDAAETLASRATAPLGDPGTPRVSLATERMAAAERATGDMGVPDAVAARGVAGAADDAARAGTPLPTPDNPTAARGARDPGEVFINFARINQPEDVQATLRDLAASFRGDVNAAGRDVQSNEATRELAGNLNLTVEELLSRRAGEPWNAETALAAREIWNASAQRLTEVARAAAAPSAGPAEEYAFRRMMAIHTAIQAEVLAARRETARALQAWAIPAGTGREQARAIEQLLQEGGEAGTTQALARRLMAATSGGANPAAIATFVRQSYAARTVSAVQEVWINALLSSPKTHLTNIASNTFILAQQIAERRVAEAMGGAVAPGEAAAMTYGMVTGLRDAFRLVARTYREGGEELGAMIGKVDLPRDPSLGSASLGVDAGSGLGLALDFIGHSIVRAPSRALGAEDAFFKSINYRAELHAGGLRMAREAALASGEHPPGSPAFVRDVADRMARLVADPPEALRMQAADQALYATFNRETYRDGVNVVAGLSRLRQAIPPLTFVMPFVRTPGNILSYSFERTPLAPLVGQWRADVAAGGARRDLALARLATGSAVMALAFDMADRGIVTGRGPDDRGETATLQRQGITPYSFQVGGRWVSYNRMDPLGFTMGFAADFADMLRRRSVEPEEVDEVNELVSAGIATISRSVLDKTYFQGIAGIVSALDQPERNAQRWLQQFAGSFVPSIVAQAEQAIDPVRREPSDVLDAVMARIPYLSERLPPRRNLWGDIQGGDVTQGRAIYDAISPVAVSDARYSPIDAELQRLNVGLEPIGRRVDFGGGGQVNLSAFPAAYDDYVRLAGNEMKVEPLGNLGLRDLLDQTVEGRGPLAEAYRMASDGRDGGKADLIRGIVQQYRTMARQEVLSLHPEIRRLVEERRVEAVQQRMPTP